MKSLFSLLALVLVASASALEWKTQHLTIKAAPLDRTAQTAFDFTNTSDKTVTIKSVDTSCDCLEAGRRYCLHISPPNTHEVANAAFRLIAKTASGQELVFSAYANVR